MKKLIASLLLFSSCVFASGGGSLGGGGGSVTPNACSAGQFANAITDASGTLACALPPVTAVSAPLVNTSGTLSIPQATGSVDGFLAQGDWNTFNGKQDALTPGAISTSTSGVTVGNGSASTVGPNVTVDVATASPSSPGLVSTSSQGFAGEKTFGLDVQITNAAVSGTPGTSSQINTGDPSTKGLIVKGNTFSGGGGYVPQANATFFASYDTTVDADYGDGPLTGTPGGGATITGGKLDLTGGGKSVVYDPANADFTETFTIRMLVTPSYSGCPSIPNTGFDLFYIHGSGSNNRVTAFHYPDCSIVLYVNDASGTLVVNIEDAGVFSPTAGQTYELEWDVDLTGGNPVRYFIDGVQTGSTPTVTGTRNGTDINTFDIGLGAYGSFYNGFIKNVIMYNTVQHTANYTAPTTYPQTGFTVQTANLQEWQNASGVALSAIDPNGNYVLGGILGTLISYTQPSLSVTGTFFGNNSDADQSVGQMFLGSTSSSVAGHNTSHLDIITGDQLATGAVDGNVGNITIQAGAVVNATSGGAVAGNVFIAGGNNSFGQPGNVQVDGGTAHNSGQQGGLISLAAGGNDAGGAGGNIYLNTAGNGTPEGNINMQGDVVFTQAVQLPVQAASTTPTCGAPQNGNIALTHSYIMCVCNGSGWVKTADGTTACTF